MAFADLQKQHATFVTSHVLGRQVEYRPHGKPTWTSFQARVKPGRDGLGQVIANAIDIEVSKEFVTAASLGHDLFRIPDEKIPGEWWPVYRLTEIRELDKQSGFYHLHCVQG